MNVDFLIVGHGLAGATLARWLQILGQQVAVVDDEEPQSASRVASGLMTPITGKRNAVSYRYQDFWQVAVPFYRQMEADTQTRFFEERRTLKVLTETDWQELGRSAQSQRYFGRIVTPVSPYRPRRAVELRSAGRLQITKFLQASRIGLDRQGAYYQARLQQDDFVLRADSIEVPRLRLAANHVICCQGIAAEPCFGIPQLPFEPAKGEILELKTTGIKGQPTLLANAWIVPGDDDRCFVGATYERNFASREPTADGRGQLLGEFAQLVDRRAMLVAQRAAIRPILRGRMPQFGLSSTDPRWGFLNGLGSKGAVRAPLVSEQFARYLVDRDPVDEEFWYQTPEQATNERLTQTAQRIIGTALQAGDIAIDATAGNGLDTQFLREHVGPQGLVFSVDIQVEALQRTQQRLAAHGMQDVELRQGSHANLLRIIPDEFHGRVSVIMFNLGYLPGGDKNCTTRSPSTLAALDQSLKLLRPGGVATVVAYTGHAAGYAETLAIEHWAQQQNSARLSGSVELPATRIQGSRPRLYTIRKSL